MAYTAVDLLIGKIVSALETEASLLGDARNELNNIKNELDCMKSFLKDASRKQVHTEQERIWISQVREKSGEIEDVIDEFMYNINRQSWHGGIFPKVIHQMIYFPRNIWSRHQVATKLQGINKNVQTISQQNKRYQQPPGQPRYPGSCSKGVHESRMVTRLKEGRDVVGMRDEIRSLSGWLMRQEQELVVVSLVGMGGSGKTTLVAQIYNDATIRGNFQCFAWITVSKRYEAEDLLRGLIKEFYQSCRETVPDDFGNNSFFELVNILRSYLKPRSYLLVLDDVWDVQFWEWIKVILPYGQNGCRVMLTTRDRTVAGINFGVKSYVHHIRPLTKNEAWELFCKNAFSIDSNNHCPAELQDLANKILKKCEGLPLAIRALGSLLYYKKSILEWNHISNSLDQQLNRDLISVKIILSLSFNDLPFRLKNCFLYCSLFPEDYMISVKRLIQLWIAEGFVEQVKGSTLEKEAASYFQELVARNMLEAESISPIGRAKICKMHDLMRELALSIAEEENFCCTVFDGRETSEVRKSTRLSIQSEGELKVCTAMKTIRSLLFFSPKKSFHSSSNTLPTGFKLLKVLDLEYFSIAKLPAEVGKLFNLRYLNLFGTPIKELPESIGKLRNLLTLDIRETHVRILPKGVAKLHSLRHLYGYCRRLGISSEFNFLQGMQVSSRTLSKLVNLQILSYVEAEADIIKKFASMSQLTRFEIANVRAADEQDLCLAIQQMKVLQVLYVGAANESEPLKLNAISSPPCFLERVYLAGKLRNFPKWISLLQNLTALALVWSELGDDPFPCLQTLPNLGRLFFLNAFTGKKLHFQKGFAKLDHIEFVKLSQITEIIIEESAMPNLRRLEVVSCLKLEKIPRGIENLANLKFLELSNVPRELVESICGECFPKVQHIDQINYWYQTPDGSFARDNLSDPHCRRSAENTTSGKHGLHALTQTRRSMYSQTRRYMYKYGFK